MACHPGPVKILALLESVRKFIEVFRKYDVGVVLSGYGRHDKAASVFYLQRKLIPPPVVVFFRSPLLRRPFSGACTVTVRGRDAPDLIEQAAGFVCTEPLAENTPTITDLNAIHQ